jgi:hypothetical protein
MLLFNRNITSVFTMMNCHMCALNVPGTHIEPSDRGMTSGIRAILTIGCQPS